MAVLLVWPPQCLLRRRRPGMDPSPNARCRRRGLCSGARADGNAFFGEGVQGEVMYGSVSMFRGSEASAAGLGLVLGRAFLTGGD